MDRIIFHDLIKVNEINNKLLAFKDLQEFTNSLLDSGSKSDIDIARLKSFGFTFNENTETNIINIDTLIKILKG